MPIDDRDKQFERALARHLRSDSPDSTCPDAEILAAYHDRTLSLEEMTYWKGHMAGCTRCQESLALVEQTESLNPEEFQPEEVLHSLGTHLGHTALSAGEVLRRSEELPSMVSRMTPSVAVASAVRPRSQPHWQLLLPLGAVAVAVIAWVGMREVRMQRVQQLATTQVAENRAALPASAAPRAEIQEELKQEQSSAQSLQKEHPPQRSPAVTSPVLVSPQSSTAPVAGAIVSGNANKSTVGQRDDSAGDSLEALKKSDSPVVPRISAEDESVQALASRPPQPVTPAAASNAATQRKQEYRAAAPPTASETVQLKSEAQQPAINGYDSKNEASGQGKLLDLARLAVTDRLYIVAPGEKHAWRVGDAGMIERTTDRGKTWKPQNSGVTAGLTAGSATSDKVCWVVGRGGTLLLTTDGGKHWKLLSSPIPEDLGGIHATNATHATIWDVPNRKSFETSDGGETWKPAANE